MKSYIAIKGNAEKGSEIIKLLEMMGGNNSEHFTGRDSSRYYFIDNNTKRICNKDIHETEKCCNGVYMLFSYDTFNDNYSWRIGDIVNVIGRNDRIGLKVVKMQWGDAYNTMMYCLDCKQDGYGWWRAEDIEYTKYSDLKVNLDDITKNIEFDLTKYSYEVKDGRLVVTEKKLVYPKTYEECCKVLGYDDRETYCVCHTGANERLFENLYSLKVCRDAYRKIAGEEMGLGKPWEPDWSTEHERKYVIEVYRNNVRTNSQGYSNTILAFPTAKMRDAFYENFKDLIESCKELL